MITITVFLVLQSCSGADDDDDDDGGDEEGPGSSFQVIVMHLCHSSCSFEAFNCYTLYSFYGFIYIHKAQKT